MLRRMEECKERRRQGGRQEGRGREQRDDLV
jgi:hypothetical protein